MFDKTGTLTAGGAPSVTDADVPAQPEGLTREDVLGLALEIESASAHPLAIAIRAYCEANRAVSHSGTSIEETPGRGLKASFTSLQATAVIGNEAWMTEHGAQLDGRVSGLLDTWKSEGKSVVLLAVRREHEGSPSGFVVYAAFAVADPVRPEAKEVLARLQAQGLGTWMISGDNAVTAKAVALRPLLADTLELLDLLSL